MTYKDEFDGLLHDALSEYRDAEPLAGLEERVLRRMRAGRGPGLKLWRRWAAAVACAVIIAVAAGIAIRGHLTTPLQPGPKPPEATVASAAPLDAPAITQHPALARKPSLSQSQTIPPTTTRSQARRSGEVVAAQRTADAVAERFPMPTPLSLEEHALLALARTHPETLGNHSENNGGVTIPLIDIKLLPEPNGDSEGDN